MKATRLRTEYQNNPLGLTCRRPRLFWWVSDGRANARQTAYRIRAASSLENLKNGKPDLWDSGQVLSAEQTHIEFQGQQLASRQGVWWDVQLWDMEGVAGPVNESAYFEMGLLDRVDWNAKFIATPLVGTGQVGAAVPLLRKSFASADEAVSARLYVSALGLYEVSINGNRVTNDVMRPGWTDYRKRVAYQTYDVTSLLQKGDNVIAAMLGDGWYCGRVAALDRGMAWGTRPSLLAQLEITLADGSRVMISSDESWRWRTGPILNSDLIAGEEYDARLEVSDWDSPGADETGWSPVQAETFPDISLEASPAPPVRVLSEIQPVADPVKMSGGWERTAFVFDFGQNLTGVVRLHVRGPAGCTLVLRHAEALKPDGSIDASNLRSARAIDHYTLRGDPHGETYTPHFTLHGFRYLELSLNQLWMDEKKHDAINISRGTATAIVLASDTEDTGSFVTDHALLNQLQSNIRWGMRGNFIEVPTDCPQRDERLGWTGDTQVFSATATFNADVAGFYAKWMRDVSDAQLANGAIPAVIPKPVSSWDWDGEAGWSDAVVVVPWQTYLAYGDRRILEDNYPVMKRWIGYLNETSREGIRCYPGAAAHTGFGDWLALDGTGNNPHNSATPRELIATAFYAEALAQMEKVARVLALADEVNVFAKRRDFVIEAFNREFVSPGGRMTVPCQTAYLLALAFDLLPEKVRSIAVERLVELIREKDWHLSTGFLGTPLLCPVLTRFGRTDVAYRLLLQETYPGWLYPITIGATTMWERWNSWHPSTGFVETSMNSLNHYAYGAVGKWMYATIGGVDVDLAKPGYANVLIKPMPGPGISRAKAELTTVRGVVSSSWIIEGQKFQLEVKIPPNTSATVTLPDGKVNQVGAGSHAFWCEWPGS